MKNTMQNVSGECHCPCIENVQIKFSKNHHFDENLQEHPSLFTQITSQCNSLDKAVVSC